ncbi:MAG: succinylglutamate desuccinylase/aspartoacylase family protein [Pseudothermotoga sp.]|uniref:succinylglutamate desuccinylase/aspartoacylase domain-containing protein n=1 Tax=Pseudothermotoga sp. TaxID=2033661 RepID=UPI00258CB099|nr:succinylglutamate desuccinylase/aspartoacylase family protein [Pseudothermotoga sp.]MDI6863874.1 succinylglutamate desuccinylase/aspartoacylase family protein [Pseudothermotoga sp.]
MKPVRILLFCAVTLVMLIGSVEPFMNQRTLENIDPGPGVTHVKKLSDYYPSLRGTVGDTDVFVLEGEEPGGCALIIGGTHPNEPAGYVTARIIVEHFNVQKGKLIVIPRANNSAFTHTQPLEATPGKVEFTYNGKRMIVTIGSRLTNPVHQWPDPRIYKAAGIQVLSGSEQRNLNRAYPGNAGGTLTEKVAYAIMQLIRTEKPHISIDLHEAAPEYTTVNAVVAHDRALDIAVEAVMMLQLEGIEISVERSPKTFRGLSHREWGDRSDTLAFLLEVANPSQGRLRGRTNEKLVITGLDKYYLRAAKAGRLNVPYDENGLPLTLRVWRHLRTIMTIIDTFNLYSEENSIVMEGPIEQPF